MIENGIVLISLMLRKEVNSYYAPRENFKFKPGDFVIVEKDGNTTLGKVVCPYIKVDIGRYDKLKETAGFIRILRKANDDDIKYFDNLTKKENNAFKVCKDKIKAHNLPMHLVATAWNENEKEFVFYFTADARVDFRALVKDLVTCFNTKIKLWQVGARDAMKFFGGLGPCGYPICCTSFLKGIESIDLNYAKMQNLPMNVSKITGLCGRLVCCLRYELEEKGPLKPEDIDIDVEGEINLGDDEE